MLDIIGPRIFTNYDHIFRPNAIHYPVLQSSVKARSAPYGLIDSYIIRKLKLLHFPLSQLKLTSTVLVLSQRAIFSLQKILFGAWTKLSWRLTLFCKQVTNLSWSYKRNSQDSHAHCIFTIRLKISESFLTVWSELKIETTQKAQNKTYENQF